MNEKKDVEKNLNPKLKDFSIQDLSDEIANRSELTAIITEKEIRLKSKCDLHRLNGLVFQTMMTIGMMINQAEAKAKTSGIVPASGIPRGTPPGFGQH